jgi:hypothetical protein
VAVMAIACSNADETPKPDPTAVPSTTSAGAGGAGGSSQTSSGGNSSTSSGPGGGDSDSQQGFVSGSRLRAVYREGSDGSREYVGFYDNLKNSHCHFRNTIDGNAYCLPDGVVTQSVSNGQYYADAACTQHVGMPGTCPPAVTAPPTYFSVGSSCMSTGVRKVVGTATTVYYFQNGCNQVTVPVAYLLGPLEPYTDWVPATIKTE